MTAVRNGTKAMPLLPRAEVEIKRAASRLKGSPWPTQAILGVDVQHRWYPLRALVVAVTGDHSISSETARRQLEQLGFVTTRFDRLAAPELAGTVVDMTKQDQTITAASPTPPPEVLEAYLGEWVAMADGQIIDHDPDLLAVTTRLRDGGIKNDRLFRVPNDLAEPVPATLG